MRKSTLAIIISAVIVAAGAGYVTIGKPFAQRANANPSTSQSGNDAQTQADRQKKLQEWQMSVQKWQEAEKAKAAASKQATTELPNTGPGDAVARFVAVAVTASAGYLAFQRRKLSDDRV